MTRRSPLLGRWKRLVKDESGLATIEFALISTTLLIASVNGVEFARWYLQRMQVANAVQSASLAAWKACDVKKLPAKTNCPGLDTAIDTGLASTALGANVKKTTGFPTEGYYCVNASGALKKVASYTDTKPANCAAVGSTTTKPGDYVVIAASYTFTPLFTGLTFGKFLPTTMSAVGSMRLQ